MKLIVKKKNDKYHYETWRKNNVSNSWTNLVASDSISVDPQFWHFLADIASNSSSSLKHWKLQGSSQAGAGSDKCRWSWGGTRCRRRTSSTASGLTNWPPEGAAGLAAVVAVQFSCVFAKPVLPCCTMFRGWSCPDNEVFSGNSGKTIRAINHFLLFLTKYCHEQFPC